MAERTNILEGVFAVRKPPHLSSAQVLRDLQTHFAKSKTFAPLLESTERQEAEQARHSKKRRRRDHDNVFKMGHGGTLDPMATGVLIVGIGRGTKYLSDFLGCTKQYDTVVLFGKSTDTYDVCGRVVAEAPYDQITQEKIEAKLAAFRGAIKQVPPVYSSLKINGMKAYEYVRSGKELPRELESRDMQVEECALVEYYEGGQHDFRWPAEEVSADERAAVEKLMKKATTTSSSSPGDSPNTVQGDEVPGNNIPDSSAAAEKVMERQPSTTAYGSTPPPSNPQPSHATQDLEALNSLSPSAKAALHTHAPPPLSLTPSPAPAARFRLNVSSGFYVRSFAHDLGIALGSYGTMAELVRSRQSDYTISPTPSADQIPTLTYADIAAGEEVWGPKVTQVLQDWMQKNPAVSTQSNRTDDRDKLERPRNYRGSRGGGGSGGGRGGHRNRDRDSQRYGEQKRQNSDRKRRNSSSPET